MATRPRAIVRRQKALTRALDALVRAATDAGSTTDAALAARPVAAATGALSAAQAGVMR